LSVADFEGDGQGRACDTLAGLGDHDRVGVYPDHPPVRAHSLSEAARLVPEPAAHVQDLVAVPDRAHIEHLQLDLLDQGISVHAIQPAEDGLAVIRLTCLLESLMQAVHDTSPTTIEPVPNLKQAFNGLCRLSIPGRIIVSGRLGEITREVFGDLPRIRRHECRADWHAARML